MLIPLLYSSGDRLREWSVVRATAYGAGIGLVAALFKIFASSGVTIFVDPGLVEIAGAAFAFALLCAGAALLRNMLVRRFVQRA